MGHKAGSATSCEELRGAAGRRTWKPTTRGNDAALGHGRETLPSTVCARKDSGGEKEMWVKDPGGHAEE